MTQGYDGGRFVYEELRNKIAHKHQLVPHMLDLRVRAFCALHALTTVLEGTRIVRRGAFIDFWQGLSDSSLHNYVVNVGRGDQAADLRVKAALADAIQDPDCFKAYLGGLDDFGYMEELRAIREMGLLEKKVHLVQVPGYAVESNYYKQYAHRAIDLDYLFRNGKLSLYDLAQRKHDVDEAVAVETKQLASTPCLFHHLTSQGCHEGERCKYSHEPLPLLHKERLRAILKRRKCPTVARGDACPYGDDCLYRH
uniref:C3H1-type domain-containing protein n=2 Tax=Kalmanozyma brasiliensis (strain GHG001) TaxID=1365824 RepID=V5EYC2_KALBG